MPVIKKENASGGKGYILIKRLLDDTELNGKCGLYLCRTNNLALVKQIL